MTQEETNVDETQDDALEDAVAPDDPAVAPDDPDTDEAGEADTDDAAAPGPEGTLP